MGMGFSEIGLNLFLFFNTNKGWDMCQNMNHLIKPRVDIEAKLHNFVRSKVMESAFPLDVFAEIFMTYSQNFTFSNNYCGTVLPPLLFYFCDVKNNINLECECDLKL